MRQACQRHLDDLEREDFAYEFDEAKALRAVLFIQELPHTKGKWAAKKELLILEPWEVFIVAQIFGWIRKSDGMRRFLEAYVEVCRKNGKSALAAGIGLYMLLCDGEFGAEVYSGATSEKQAWEVFRPAKQMADRTPDLKDAFGVEVNASNILKTDDLSRFEPIIGNPGDGSSPSCAIVDEYHEHKKSDLYDTMKTGMGGREQPLMFVITTAGVDIGGPCYEKRLEAQKLLDGVFEDDRTFCIIYTLDEDDDWKDPACWGKANPNLGVSVSRDYLEAQIGAAIRSPSKQNTVKTKHFNIWCGAKSIWLPMEKWNEAGDASLSLGDFAGERCMVGLDLAVRVDMAARGLLFTKEVDGRDHFYFFPTFYLPETALEAGKNADRYQGWHKAGFLEVHEGEEIDFNQIQAELLEVPEDFQVDEIGFDMWQAAQMSQTLRDQGLETVSVKTTYTDMSGPMRELEAALASGRFHHPDNPILNWMASNVVAKCAGDDDRIRPVKELPENKIDGMIALLMAMNRAMVTETKGSLDDFLNSPITANF